MAETCECYKKLKYQEYCKNLETPQEPEAVESTLDHRTSVLNQREKAVRLPGVIHIKDSVLEFPDARQSDLPRLFQEMSEIISGVEDYEFNILSFWILDVFLEGLRTAQLSGMCQRNQKIALHWMVFVYNVMQGSGSKLTRRDLFLKIKVDFLASADDDNDDESNSTLDTKWQDFDEEGKQWKVPFPPVWHADTDRFPGETPSEVSTREREESETVDPEQNLRDTETIMEIIYNIYARLWSYFLLRASLRSTPNLEIVDLPFKLNVPKQVLKYDSALKSDKGCRRTASQRATEQGGSGRESTKNDYILPLQAALGADTLLRELFALPSHESIISERDKGKQEKKKK